MTSKKVEIMECGECPFFDNMYYDYAQECERLNRAIVFDKEIGFKIPDDCPLMDWD